MAFLSGVHFLPLPLKIPPKHCEGLGLTALKPDEVVALHEAVGAEPRAPIACIGPGTGLGEVFLTWQSDAAHPDGG
jgi:glucokinase